MITYFYWAGVIALVILSLGLVGGAMGRWRTATVLAIAALLVGWAAYYFHFQQICRTATFISQPRGRKTISGWRITTQPPIPATSMNTRRATCCRAR
jgi:hypothetical protein